MKIENSLDAAYVDELKYRIERHLSETRRSIRASRQDKDFRMSHMMMANRSLARAEVLVNELQKSYELIFKT